MLTSEGFNQELETTESVVAVDLKIKPANASAQELILGDSILLSTIQQILYLNNKKVKISFYRGRLWITGDTQDLENISNLKNVEVEYLGEKITYPVTVCNVSVDNKTIEQLSDDLDKDSELTKSYTENSLIIILQEFLKSRQEPTAEQTRKIVLQIWEGLLNNSRTGDYLTSAIECINDFLGLSDRELASLVGLEQEQVAVPKFTENGQKPTLTMVKNTQTSLMETKKASDIKLYLRYLRYFFEKIKKDAKNKKVAKKEQLRQI